MAAFRLAASLGADAIELDAKLSADGVIVVHHDSTLDRTTSGSGPVSSRTIEELRELDAGSKFSGQYAGEPIPTLREVLVELGHKLLVNIELTNYARPWDDLPARVVALVKELELERRVLFSSFNPVALGRVKKIEPRIPTGLLLLSQEPGWARALLRKIVKHDALHPQEKLINRDEVEFEHSMGRAVNAWTVNDVGRMRELLAMGVDGLITDIPDVAREALHDGHASD